MEKPVEVWKWWIRDERTGKRRLTRWHMTETDARARYTDPEPDPSSREERRSQGTAATIVTKGLKQ